MGCLPTELRKLVGDLGLLRSKDMSLDGFGDEIEVAEFLVLLEPSLDDHRMGKPFMTIVMPVQAALASCYEPTDPATTSLCVLDGLSVGVSKCALCHYTHRVPQQA